MAEDKDSGIAVYYSADNYDDDVKVVIEEEFDGSQYLAYSYSKVTAFNIKTVVDNAQVQPKGKVTVRIPLPAGYSPEKTFIYHINSVTGEREKMGTEVRDGYVYFETDGFSIYVVVDESSQVNTECSCACHSSNPIKRIFWKISVFFYKLFKIESKRICVCGEAHW